MANKHPGNLADVFKHLALGEILASLTPAEYWESHAGAAFTPEPEAPPAERRHGIHHFVAAAQESIALRPSTSFRVAARNLQNHRLTALPGSPALAREFLTERTRRYLFCDTDADSLQSIRQLYGASPAIECIQDDGIMILRGAAMLLPEGWTASTFAFIDPYDILAVSDADISSLQLFCELANRTIRTMLFYAFKAPAERISIQAAIRQSLEKSRLLGHNIVRLEGSITAPVPDAPTQWGFGLLLAQIPANALEQVDRSLRALQTLYASSSTPPPGGFDYTRSAL